MNDQVERSRKRQLRRVIGFGISAILILASLSLLLSHQMALRTELKDVKQELTALRQKFKDLQKESPSAKRLSIRILDDEESYVFPTDQMYRVMPQVPDPLGDDHTPQLETESQ